MLNTIEEAIEDLQAGKLIIVVDDEKRENEGDFIGLAESCDANMVNFMSKYGRGLICASITDERADELELPLMVKENTVLHHTPFTVSVDLIGHGCTTGISAHDRAATIRALISDDTKPTDLGRPGHIFPLRARKGGVLRRAGHTEATIDLARLSGSYPAGVLVEIMNDDGTMARLPELEKIAEEFDMKIICIKDLIAFRIQNETQIERLEQINMPTKFGDFELVLYKQLTTGDLHIALVKGEITADEPTLLRVHSSCVTGDVLHSLRCDCGEQLNQAMQMVQNHGKGVVLYMNQEGRGIGLHNKIKAYKLQEEGYDTVEANEKLGFSPDERDYGIGAQILRDLGIQQINLISNNPRKRVGLDAYGLEIVDTTPIQVKPNPHNEKYLATKKSKLGHDL